MILWKGMWNSHKAGDHPVKKYVKWTNLWNTLAHESMKKKSVPAGRGGLAIASYKLKGTI